jgi:hypothetical protein
MKSVYRDESSSRMGSNSREKDATTASGCWLHQRKRANSSKRVRRSKTPCPVLTTSNLVPSCLLLLLRGTLPQSTCAACASRFDVDHLHEFLANSSPDGTAQPSVPERDAERITDCDRRADSGGRGTDSSCVVRPWAPPSGSAARCWTSLGSATGARAVTALPLQHQAVPSHRAGPLQHVQQQRW